MCGCDEWAADRALPVIGIHKSGYKEVVGKEIVCVYFPRWMDEQRRRHYGRLYRCLPNAVWVYHKNRTHRIRQLNCKLWADQRKTGTYQISCDGIRFPRADYAQCKEHECLRQHLAKDRRICISLAMSIQTAYAV